jgi:hypothetical protein
MNTVNRTNSRRIKEFPVSVAEQIDHYVYLLLDPATDKPFYVGKGVGNRMFQHEHEALSKPQTKSAKLQQIRCIAGTGKAVEYIILRHGLTRVEAAEVESAIIDYIGLENLANKQGGYRASKRGLMRVPEIIAQYAAESTEINEPVILIKVNKLWQRNISPDRLKDITRGDWPLGERRNKAKYAFAVYRGIIRQVYRIDHHQWQRVRVEDSPVRGKKEQTLAQKAKIKDRWRFDGEIAYNMQHYVGKRIPEKLLTRGARFPIRYVNCD